MPTDYIHHWEATNVNSTPTAISDNVAYGYDVAIGIPEFRDMHWEVTDVHPTYDLPLRVGFEFWSIHHGQAFRLTEQIDARRWAIQWIDNIETSAEPSIVFMQENNELNYIPNEPFLRGEDWYVVMGGSGFYSYQVGQIWYSENNEREFRLGQTISYDVFGTENTFRIEWVDEEHDIDFNDGYSEEIEEIDVREIAPVIATNIGREVPSVSFEQEFSGNGDLVEKKLYLEGFATNRFAEAYHNSEGRFENPDNNRFCYVETDSSCGYELIFDRMNLRNREEAEKISAVQTILRGLKNEGLIKLSARCGFHIHVDVSDWGMKEIVSAYHLWNYLEDPIFRFSSAFWNGHRDEEVGGDYSTPVPKGYLGRRDIGRNLSERRDALNFSPILRARGNCNCSANFYEDWANCTCNIRQPTLEFRVFNATLNQRKIKAYLAFCIAFVNKAKSFDFTPEVFPEMRWLGTYRTQSQNGKSWIENSVERINFIMNEFPLTGSEKSDVMYCLRNCSLEPVLEYL